ncbi:MAG: inositol monophosphatase family protein [Pseudomonadota bacterium]
MSRPSPVGTVMINAARAAGRTLARDFGEVENLQVSKKGPADFVSSADHRAEETIYESLKKARPGYGFLMEERGIVEGSDRTNRFIVDPLDGTLNFLHGQPHFAVSIALEREGKLLTGVVYDVAKNEIFWAETGRGCWLEQRKLRVSSRRKTTEAVIATGTPWHGRGEQAHETFWGELAALTPVTAGIRRYGSAALDLAYVAAGRFDGFWERGLKPWDIAAGIVLVQEAGGMVDELDGGDVLETGSVLASNGQLQDTLAKRLRKAQAFARAVPTDPQQD